MYENGLKVGNTYSVSAAVDTKTGGQNNTGNNGEESGDHIKDGKNNSDRKTFLEASADAPKDNNHVEDGHEDCIVDFARVACESFRNNVANQSQSEEDEDELNGPEAKLRDLHCEEMW